MFSNTTDTTTTLHPLPTLFPNKSYSEVEFGGVMSMEIHSCVWYAAGRIIIYNITIV
jgi:surface antigen